MGRPTNKADLLTAAAANYEKLNVLISGLTEKELMTPLDFSDDEKKNMLQKSHTEVMKLAETFSDEQLFSKGIYKWVGGSSLGSYFISVTSSHYDWAMKKLKAHKKNCAQK